MQSAWFPSTSLWLPATRHFDSHGVVSLASRTHEVRCVPYARQHAQDSTYDTKAVVGGALSFHGQHRNTPPRFIGVNISYHARLRPGELTPSRGSPLICADHTPCTPAQSVSKLPPRRTPAWHFFPSDPSGVVARKSSRLLSDVHILPSVSLNSTLPCR